jgi:Flp pilus assembly protein TadG
MPFPYCDPFEEVGDLNRRIRMRSRRNLFIRRRGATAVEAAFVLPVAFMLIIGMVVLGMGIFRYQQMASLAREAARYASAHGSLYYRATGNNYQAADIYNNSIKPMAVGLNLSNLTYQIQWGTYTSGSWVWTNWGSSSSSPPTSTTSGGATLYNGVQVTVTYTWMPELYIAGPINLTSTSVMPMSF